MESKYWESSNYDALPEGKLYFFTRRCDVCRYIAERMRLRGFEGELAEHNIAVRERKQGAICFPHERWETRPFPYVMSDAEIEALAKVIGE